ncbi:MAG: zinc ABC transporter substrate-binding protein [Syntrophales bacterium]
MKKSAYLAITLSLLIILGSCKGIASASGKIQVAVSVLPQAYFVERVGGNRVNVQVMIPKGASPEIYEPIPQQLVRLSDSHIYIKIGVPTFPFERKYLPVIGGKNNKMTVVNMSDGARYREDDPHVWTSPSYVKIAARNICEALSLYDPQYRDYYRKNLALFLGDIDELDRKIRTMLAGRQGYAFMVYHPAWSYFAEEYGLKQLAIEEEGKIKGASHIKEMIDTARQKGIKVILAQKGFDTKTARTIAHEIGGRVMEVDPLDRNWLDGMETFAKTLQQVLRK